MSPADALFLQSMLVLGAYLVGSISPGWLLARRAGVDLRSAGSGVTGASNAARVLGRSAYGWVLVLDALKGLLVVAFAEAYAPGSTWAALTGPAVVAGHIWPIWLGFRGGRGAATYMGVCLAYDWRIVALAWIPGLLFGLVVHKGFAVRAVGFLASLPIGWWLLRGPVYHQGIPGTIAQLALASCFSMVLLAHRGHFAKHVPG
ncbi:MAG TPA: glycerol-3-phosphate acyltransferase [Opitutaceae bacterium]|nr:glycerol-3-phosphate acyltransferase [Opitutaceae bacterium]